jgi:hypothetical protein
LNISGGLAVKKNIRCMYFAGLLVSCCLPLSFALVPQTMQNEDFGPGAVIAQTFEAANISQWNTAAATIAKEGNGKNYIINITGNFSMPGTDGPTFGSVSYVKISIRGKDNTLSLSEPGSLLLVGRGQTVILRDVILQSIMEDRIFVNKFGLVDVADGGICIMRSGMIFGNPGTVNNAIPADDEDTAAEANMDDGDSKVYVGASADASLQEKADPESETIRLLPQYTELTVLGKAWYYGTVNDRWGRWWYKINIGSEVGWVFDAFLTRFARPETISPEKPILMISDTLEFPDGRTMYGNAGCYNHKIDAIRVYEGTNKTSSFTEIADTEVLLYQLPDNEDWLYLTTSNDNSYDPRPDHNKPHGFIYVYDISEKSYYGDIENEAESDDDEYQVSNHALEYALVKKYPRFKRHGPLFEIEHNKEKIKIWDAFIYDNRRYNVIDYYPENDTILVHKTFTWHPPYSIRSLQKGGELVWTFGGHVYFNKARNAVVICDYDYGPEAKYLHMYVIKDGLYVRVDPGIEKYIKEGHLKGPVTGARWINDNEAELSLRGADSLFIKRKNANSDFEFVFE